MKQRNNLVILSLFLAASLGIGLYAQTYTVPSPISSRDVAVWANRGGFIASGTAAPSAVASDGALYVDTTIATAPTLYRYASGAWAIIAAGGNSDALNAHIASQTDPHGATMTVSQEITIGDPAATQTAYIDSPSAGIARIASYIQLVYDNTMPTSALSSSAITLWADNASKCAMLHNGSSWTNLCGTYGGIHAHDNATSQSIPNGTAYATITALIDTHASNDVLVSTSTQTITINRGGVYRISFNISFYTDTNDIIGYFAAFQNSTELDQVHLERKIGTGADVGSSAASGFVRLNAGDIITLRARHSHTSAVAVTITYGNLNVERVGT